MGEPPPGSSPCGRLAGCQGSRGSDRRHLAGQGPWGAAGTGYMTGVLQVGGQPLLAYISERGTGALSTPTRRRQLHVHCEVLLAVDPRGDSPEAWRLRPRGGFSAARGSTQRRLLERGCAIGCAAGSPFSFLGRVVPGSGTGTRRSASARSCSSPRRCVRWRRADPFLGAARVLWSTGPSGGPRHSTTRACSPPRATSLFTCRSPLRAPGTPGTASHEPALRRALRHCATWRGTRWAPGTTRTRVVDATVEPCYGLICKYSHVAA